VIRHLALFRFRQGLTDSERAAFHVAVTALASQIPDIARCTAGPALRLQESPIDYVLALDFADDAAFHRYKAHPAHRRLIDDHVRPCVEETVRAQVVLSDG
jgi:hypothetical protein